MSEFTAIPLTPSKILNFTGRVLGNAICLGRRENNDILVVGNLDGTLCLFLFDNEEPLLVATEVGSICCIKIDYISLLKDIGVLVATLEGKSYIFEIIMDRMLGFTESWTPRYTQQLLLNPQCIALYQNEDSKRTELFIGTSYGVFAHYKMSGKDSKASSPWKAGKLWTLGNEITSICIRVRESEKQLFLGEGDGSVLIIHPTNDNPERASNRNYITEVCGKDSTYVMVTTYQNCVAAVNGNGKIGCFDSVGVSDKPSESSLTTSITKRPVFIGYLNSQTVAIGTSDGCVYFVSENISNYYRYEEVPQAYAVDNLSTPTMAIVAHSGNIVIFSCFTFLNNVLPSFIENAQKEIEELREKINDSETSAEKLISTYLYMPLR
ncbi:ITFG2 [Blepharisma stoltei]|uniref:Uncharacterized protein n=1 Tax=Blepharisma stoltei TaxID=1481888 RepID=A0AAU9K355_9CILI|nr:unnamed protein product [Blepharisma stoltei]